MDTKTRHLLVLFYSTITLAFVVIIALSQRSYQDAWILEDIFIPTVLYALVFASVVVIMDDNRVVALICASFIIILNAIPNLKYQLFYGTYDSVGHFGFIKNLLSLGSVPEVGFYSKTYSDFPGTHILIGSFSLVAGVDPNVGIKFVTSTIFGVIPLLTYLLTNQVFDKKLQKYIVVASGLPIVISYVLTGTTFGAILFCILFYLLFKRNLSKENKRRYTLTLIIVAFGLLFSHAVTMLSLVIFLCIMFFLMKFFYIAKKASPNILSRTITGILSLLLISFIAWLMYRANFVFETFIEAMQRLLIGGTVKTPIPTRFFEIPLPEQLKIFMLKHIKDAVIITLSFAGFYILLKKFKRKNGQLFKNFYAPLTCLLGAILLVVTFQFVTNFGEIEYRRFLDYAMLFSPFFAGIFLWHVSELLKTTVKKKWFSTLIVALILFVCILISIVQIFPYQPLVPRANVLSQNLPENEYISDFRMVNTIYQQEMILFAEKFSPKEAIVTSDTVTRWQIFGFANENFSSRYIWYNPLQPHINNENAQWNLFLLHYLGRAGPLSEKVEYRTKEVINNLRNTLGNTIYDNGESFIISK